MKETKLRQLTLGDVIRYDSDHYKYEFLIVKKVENNLIKGTMVGVSETSNYCGEGAISIEKVVKRNPCILK